MREKPAVLLLLVLLAGYPGCSGDSGTDPSRALVGTWVRPIRSGTGPLEGIRFDADSTCGFIGIHTMNGLDWRMQGDTLIVNTNTERYPDPLEVRTARVEAGPDTLVLGADLGYLGGTYVRDDDASGRVTGTVTHRERIALPESASLHLTLRELTGFLPTGFVAGQTIPAGGRQVPIPFHLTYAAASIDSTKGYELEALIVKDGEPLYVPAQIRHVITRGNPDQVAMVIHRVPSPTPVRRLKGMYMVMADAGLFTDCETGRRYPVAQEGDNAALEAAYLDARSEPGEFLLVILSARWVVRPRMEGEGSQQMVLVERFLEILPEGTCTSVP